MNARKPADWETLAYSDKIAWRCANPDLGVDYAIMADKHRVKEFVRDKFPVPATYLYARSPDEIDALALPTTYVMKAAHGWNMSLLVENGIARGGNYSRDVMGQPANTEFLRNVGREWFASTCEHDRRRVERHYLFVAAGILFEELLKPVDYELKLFLFHGRMRYAQVFYRGFHHDAVRFQHFDGEWRPLAPGGDCARFHASQMPAMPPLPQSLLEKLNSVCGEIDHVRADFYYCGGQYFFSEFTFTNNGTGGPGFIGDYDRTLGAFWPR